MEATSNIYTAIIGIMNDVPVIGKDSKNTQQGFMYRGIDAMYNELHGLFAKHGVFVTSEVLDITREERVSKAGSALIYTVQKVKFTFTHISGTSVSSTITGEGMDSADKGSNKSLSIALKYALMQLLLIPTEELKASDPDAETHEIQPKSAAQPVVPAQAAPKPNLKTGTDTWNAAVVELSKHEGLVFDFFDKVRKKYALTEANEKLMTEEADKVRASQVTEPTEAEKVAALNKQSTPAAEITQEIRDKVAAATDIPTLTDLYNDNTVLHSNKEFLEMFSARKKQITFPPKGNAKRGTAAA